MTLEEFQARPREEWDFSVLCDELELMILSQAGWRERAERLEAERGGLRDQLLGVYRGRDEARADVERLRASQYALEERIYRLRAALERHGRHDAICDVNLRRGCSCGLDEALEEK